MEQISIYDTTLRDGTQSESISFSVEDKLKVVQCLDEFGVQYIEGGWPGSNPRDIEFFRRARSLQLKHAKISAFGSTRRAKNKAQDDANLRALIEAETPVVTIFGKSWLLHVFSALQISDQENLDLIEDSVAFLVSHGREVIYDAEHFFDGYKQSPEYAVKSLQAAKRAGASRLVLCDTNGGTLTLELSEIVKNMCREFPGLIGIHTHNDSELAVANSLAAVVSGALQVQGTINGYGERCGNTNLCSVIANLKLKMGINCVSNAQLAKLTEVSHFVSEAANLPPEPSLPYVGASAFSHKAGYHVSGVTKWLDSYQHIDPAKVGNHLNVVVSELSGKGNIIYKAKERGLNVPLQGKEARILLEQIKLQESRGFQYDNAEASFDLLVYRAQPDYQPLFELVDFMVVVEKRRRQATRKDTGEMLSEAMVKVKVDGKLMHTAAEGNGPVNALDAALRQALLEFYPELAVVKLIDYKVRILAESTGTESLVRVLIESTDGTEEWRTVGSSTDIIEASWLALADGLEYWLLKNNKTKK